jgi:hypothetical protein
MHSSVLEFSTERVFRVKKNKITPPNPAEELIITIFL